MAYSVKPYGLHEVEGEVRADKVVISTGPSFSAGLKLILVGAALGAAGALYWKSQQESKPAPPSPAPGQTDEAAADLAARLKTLAERAKSLASRARETMHSAAEIAAPAVQAALNEAKQAAREAENDINDELRELNKKENKPEQV